MSGARTRHLRQQAKEALRAHLPTELPSVVVASMGRSGSTLVFDSIADAFVMSRFGRLGRSFPTLSRAIVRGAAFEDLNGPFLPGVVYKTHALAHELPEGTHTRVVFMYGKPSDAAQSVLSCQARYGADWLERHLTHLRARGPADEIVARDVLRFEEQIDGWTQRTDVPVLGLRYETLWDHKADLEEFVGVRVHLPERQERIRATSLSTESRHRLQATYDALDLKIEGLPDVIRAGRLSGDGA